MKTNIIDSHSNPFKTIKKYLNDLNNNWDNYYKLGKLYKKMGANPLIYQKYFYKSYYKQIQSPNRNKSLIKILNYNKSDFKFSLKILSILMKTNDLKYNYKFLQVFKYHDKNPLFKYNSYLKTIKKNNPNIDTNINTIIIKMQFEIINYYINKINENKLFINKCNFIINSALENILKINYNKTKVKFLDKISKICFDIYLLTNNDIFKIKTINILKIGQNNNNYRAIFNLGVIFFNDNQLDVAYQYFNIVKNNVKLLKYIYHSRLYLYIAIYKITMNKTNYTKYIDLSINSTNNKQFIIDELSTFLGFKSINYIYNYSIECPVMYQNYNYAIELDCKHKFSIEIYSWIVQKSNCPICRKQLTNEL